MRFIETKRSPCDASGTAASPFVPNQSQTLILFPLANYLAGVSKFELSHVGGIRAGSAAAAHRTLDLQSPGWHDLSDLAR